MSCNVRHRIWRWLFMLVSGAMLFGADIGSVRAQSCTYTIDDVNFGTITPIDNEPALAQATFTATCTGTENQTVKVCLGLGGGGGSPATTSSPRLMLSGADQLEFDIYSDASRTMRWGNMAAPGSGTPPPLFLQLPATAGNPATGTQTLYFKIGAGQQSAPPGTYMSDFAPNHTGIHQTYSATGTCDTAAFSRANFLVQATVQNECDIAADPLDFGSHGVLTANVDSTADLHVTCTPGTNYTVSLGNGQNGSSQVTRKMSNGAGTIAYGLYSDSNRTKTAGSEAGSTLAFTGTGFSETITVYGRVPPQSTPAAGTYQDVVVVTVTY